MPQLTKEETIEIVLDLPSRDGNKLLRQHVITLDQVLEVASDIEAMTLSIAERFAHNDGNVPFFFGSVGGDPIAAAKGFGLGAPETSPKDVWGALLAFYDKGPEGLFNSYNWYGRMFTKGSLVKDFPFWSDLVWPREHNIRELISRSLWARGGKRKTRKVESRIV